MHFVMDPVNIVNLILCILILIFGINSYNKTKDKIRLYIVIAFGIFGFSHLMALMGLEETLEIFLIIIRIIAYLLVLISVFHIKKD